MEHNKQNKSDVLATFFEVLLKMWTIQVIMK